MGDININIDSHISYEYIMGHHDLGTKNKNGHLSMETCAYHNPVIKRTIFPYKKSNRLYSDW